MNIKYLVSINHDSLNTPCIAREMNNLIFTKPGTSEPDDVNSSVDKEASTIKTKTSMQYVNPKQFERILLRRAARKKITSILTNFKQFQQKFNRELNNKSYLHESRHNHAMKRARGPGGRFLTASEIKQQQEVKVKEEAT